MRSHARNIRKFTWEKLVGEFGIYWVNFWLLGGVINNNIKLFNDKNGDGVEMNGFQQFEKVGGKKGKRKKKKKDTRKSTKIYFRYFLHFPFHHFSPLCFSACSLYVSLAATLWMIVVQTLN